LAEYLTWGRVHQKDDIPFLKTRLGNTPFFEDGSSLKIRTDIQKNIPGTTPDMAPETLQRMLLRNARLFLSMAQLMDLDTRAVLNEVNKIERLESSLFDSLKGEAGAPVPVADPTHCQDPDEPSDYMVEARMTAWTRLFFHHQAATQEALSSSTGPTLFATCNRAVIDLVTAQVPDGQRLEHLPPEYAMTQARAAESAPDSNGSESEGFEFFMFPLSPEALFRKCTGVTQPAGMPTEALDDTDHTILALKLS